MEDADQTVFGFLEGLAADFANIPGEKKKTEREILRETQATLSKLAIQRG